MNLVVVVMEVIACMRVRFMWRLSTLVEVQAKGDHYLFTFTNERDVIRVKKWGPWGYQRAMIFLNDYDGFTDIMILPLEFFWIWVDIQDLPAALTTTATARLVVRRSDQFFRLISATSTMAWFVYVLPSLSMILWLEIRRIRVSLVDVLTVKFKYESLLGCCRDCTMINHGGLPCPRLQ